MPKTFSHLVISGTSGVGKTYLEEKLEETGLFSPLPKITDREIRPQENPQKIISISKENFLKKEKNNDFFFTLKYANNNYGWQKKDLHLNNRRKTLAITLESLAPFLKQNTNFLSILLEIKPENFDLLERRMKQRGDSREKIAERLALAREEYQKMSRYRETVQKYGGLIFEIKDDFDIPNTVIPEILKVLL